MARHVARLPLCFALCACLALGACDDVTTDLIPAPADSNTVVRPPGVRDAGGGRKDAAGDAAASGPCGDHRCACDDQMDQDGDLLIDGFDPECTGLLDDDESSFGTGHDEVTQACQDCFWDYDSDGANDGCAYPRTCTESGAASTDGTLSCSECSVATVCSGRCRPRTPNGCDCFGCCTFTRKNGQAVNVRIQAGCNLDSVDDEQACPRCIPSADCQKACGECELCLGRKRRDLAKHCRGMPQDPEPTPVCDEGETPCSETVPCPAMFYCQQGCCLITLF